LKGRRADRWSKIDGGGLFRNLLCKRHAGAAVHAIGIGMRDVYCVVLLVGMVVDRENECGIVIK
jgi:hypothetical protein